MAFTALPAMSFTNELVMEMYVFVELVARPRIFFRMFKSLVLKLTISVTPSLLLVVDVLVNVSLKPVPPAVDCSLMY